MTLDGSRTRCKILFEVLLVCTVFTFLILMEFGVLPEIQSIGFYCGDPKISHKYKGDTVTAKTLISSLIFGPILLMSFVEYGCYGRHAFTKRADGKQTWFSQSLAWYREYLSGLLIVFFLTSFGKVLIGEPRPHFLDTCKPFQAFNCTSGYVSSYTCTNSEVNSLKVRDASKSFPSGHAALSVYCFTFCAWYLQRRMVGVSVLVVAWLQVLLATWALTCSLTRITDHRHHWWDVLAGTVLGLSLGVYSIHHFGDNFRKGTYRTLDTPSVSDPEKQSSDLYKDSVSGRRLLPPSPASLPQGLQAEAVKT